jgi:hypothetical protein
MISEIGKLLTLLFINLDSNHPLIVKICETISKQDLLFFENV